VVTLVQLLRGSGAKSGTPSRSGQRATRGLSREKEDGGLPNIALAEMGALLSYPGGDAERLPVFKSRDMT